MSDLIELIADSDCTNRTISNADAVKALEKCINAAALVNGYADEDGLPFPDTEFFEDEEPTTEFDSEAPTIDMKFDCSNADT